MKERLKPIGSMHLTNTAGLLIYAVDTSLDVVLVALQIIGNEPQKSRKYKLHETRKGSYFNFKRGRYYLSAFMSC